MRRWLNAVLCLLLASSVVLAQQTDGRDPATEQRATRLAELLRCLVCQNQSIADSNAPLARDLKLQIREQILQGRSDTEIVDYMVARYGDFVLYRPPVKTTTVVLWIGPFVALLLALTALALRVAKSTRPAAAAPLSHEERVRAAGLLGADAGQQRR